MLTLIVHLTILFDSLIYKLEPKKSIADFVAEYHAIEAEAKRRQNEIVWNLAAVVSKSEIARLLDIDRRTLYNRHFTK